MPVIPGYLTVSEVAKMHGIDEAQVRRYCMEKKLRAEKIDQQWMILESDAKKFKRRPNGNPSFQNSYGKSFKSRQN